ncbi:hypothetical protein Tco_0107379, partial [Tanacetum coccineum]
MKHPSKLALQINLDLFEIICNVFLLFSLHQLVLEPKFLINMFPRKSEGEELEYPFFEGDGSSSDEWRDYVYDTDIEDVIEEEEGFIKKGGFGEKEDNIEDVVVVANDLCYSMIQTTLNVDFEEDINTKSHELVSFAKSIIIKRVMARIEEQLGKFVDQLANRMNGMINPRRPRDRNNQGSKGKGSENPFFESDDSSSDEQPDRPRRNQREDKRRWESGMRINIPEFDG